MCPSNDFFFPPFRLHYLPFCELFEGPRFVQLRKHLDQCTLGFMSAFFPKQTTRTLPLTFSNPISQANIRCGA